MSRPGGALLIPVLVVDPDPEISITLTGICEKSGIFEVYSAASGEAALAWILAEGTGVVISGSALPGMSGSELLSALRGNGIRVPFIFFADHDSAELRTEAYRHDAYAFIVKNGKDREQYMKLMRLLYWVAGYSD